MISDFCDAIQDKPYFLLLLLDGNAAFNLLNQKYCSPNLGVSCGFGGQPLVVNLWNGSSLDDQMMMVAVVASVYISDICVPVSNQLGNKLALCSNIHTC